MPKYSLRLTSEKPADMQSSLELALSTTTAEVWKAAAHPDTRAYDPFRHVHLRQTYVTLYVIPLRAESHIILDSHKDFISGGGHSEHTTFLQAVLLDKAQPIARGPKHSQPTSKKPKAKAKRSARTMLET